jgi:hypothetical protein
MLVITPRLTRTIAASPDAACVMANHPAILVGVVNDFCKFAGGWGRTVRR